MDSVNCNDVTLPIVRYYKQIQRSNLVKPGLKIMVKVKASYCLFAASLDITFTDIWFSWRSLGLDFVGSNFLTTYLLL